MIEIPEVTPQTTPTITAAARKIASLVNTTGRGPRITARQIQELMNRGDL